MAFNRTTGRRHLYKEIDELGLSLTLSHYSGNDAQTSDPRLVRRGSKTPASMLRGRYLIRPDRDSGDQYRAITDVSYSDPDLTLAVEGEVWTNTADTNAEISMLTLDELTDVMNKALEELTHEEGFPLFHGPDDADHQDATATTDWNGSSATLARQTTASEVLRNGQSQKVTDDAGGGFMDSKVVVRMGQGERGVMFVLSKADIGTWTAAVLDQDDNSLESVSFDQEAWLLIRKEFELASDDEGVFVRLTGTAAADEADVQWGPWVVKRNEPVFTLPDWIDRKAKFNRLESWRFNAAGRGADTYLAGSVEKTRLDLGVHFSYANSHENANPREIWILDEHKELLAWPLVAVFDMPGDSVFGIATSFSAESSEVDVDLDLFEAQVEIILADRYPADFGHLMAPNAQGVPKAVAKKMQALRNEFQPQPVSKSRQTLSNMFRPFR